MPNIDPRIFSFALTGFLFFGAANLTIELMISFVLLCKKLKAIIRTPYDVDSGKLKSFGGSVHPDYILGLNSGLLSQVVALSPADRQLIVSVLQTLSNTQFAEASKIANDDSDSGQAEDLGWVRFTRTYSSSNLTH